MQIMKSTFRTTTVRVMATLAVAVTFSGCAMKGDIRLLQEELRAIAARQDSLVTELRMEAQQTQARYAVADSYDRAARAQSGAEGG